ncbi:MAG: PSD1 domain-containing protein [Planctomycetaceae bacterium]|nr:PSD1 domain-containing protein [Planctomycetaceae bacterium]
MSLLLTSSVAFSADDERLVNSDRKGSSTLSDQDETQPSHQQVEFFEKNIRPILVQRCYECHAGNEINGGLSVESRQSLLRGGDSGAAISVGAPDKSLLIEVVRYTNRDLQMPPQSKLPEAEIRALEEWVAIGAPDPRAEPSDAAPEARPMGMSIEEGRQFWSFRPVQNSVVPEVQNSAWVKNPIDAFVLQRLEQAEMQPAAMADRETLIRRVTFDLIGLPPTPEEIDAFVADQEDGAWQKVVDRLLESPQYGVRWGRHWLDVARYADSNGLDENLAYGNAWRYRDYVIDAFNNNKPFDQFVVEQLAGDLLPGATAETKTATGFLALGAKVLAEPDMEKLVMDTIDEQLDCVGKVFMGMTLGCVRCHDHKFDPIKQDDYYGLAAIFKSTRTFSDTRTGVIKHWYEHSFATEEELAAIKKVDEELAKLKSAASSFRNTAMAKLREDARSKAADYLVAATRFDVEMPLSQVEQIAEPLKLHPRILHHCRRHLEFHRDDPFFAVWHRLVADNNVEAIGNHYRQLFADAETAFAELKKKDSSAKSLNDPVLEEARTQLNDLSGFLAVPPKAEFAFDAETLAEYNRLEEIARVAESNAPDESAAMGVSEQETLATLPIHIRGSHLNLGKAVAREFPAVMRTSVVRPVLPSKESGRLEFAEWLSSTTHPLTARVFVNRIWGWHFGRPLVNSTENFGTLGDRPTHPELLDWLAWRFMESGWSVKELHRLILSSSTWQMASTNAFEHDYSATDPENLLLWKFRLQRLDAEQLRDSLLAVAGRLDLSIGGKTVPLRNRQFVFNHTSVDHTKYDSLRRAVYLPVIRNNLYTLFEQFDFPDPTMPLGHRNTTTIAPQALLMMNADLVMDSADELASNVLASASTDDARIRLLYRKMYGRAALEAEISRCLNFLQETMAERFTAAGVPTTDQHAAWTLLCQSLYAANEFIYVR